MTIEVSAHDTETYFFAYAWNVEQKVGTHFPENENQYATLDEAIYHASVFGRQRDEKDIRCHNRYSKFELWIYGIRAWWNPKIAAGLVKYQALSRSFQAHADRPDSEKLKIDLLPDTLELRGKEVPIGTLIWMVDAYSATMREYVVDAARPAYYGEQAKANCMYYSCGNSIGFTSTQAENTSFDKSGQFYFFIKEEAVAFCKVKLQEKLAKLQEQFDQM